MQVLSSKLLAASLILAAIEAQSASVAAYPEQRDIFEQRGTKLQCRKQAVGNIAFITASSIDSSPGSDTGILGSLSGSADSVTPAAVAGFQSAWDLGKVKSASTKSKRDSVEAGEVLARADKKKETSKEGRKALSKQHSLHHHHVESKSKSSKKESSKTTKEKHLHHQLSESSKSKVTKPEKAVVKADSREGQLQPLVAAPAAAAAQPDTTPDASASSGKVHSTKSKSSHTHSKTHHSTHKDHSTKTKSKSKGHKATHTSASKSKSAAAASATPEPASSSLLVLLAPVTDDAAKSAAKPDTTPIFSFYSCSSPLNNVYGTLNGDSQQLVGQVRDGTNCLARKDVKGTTYVVQQQCFLRDNAKLERQLWTLDYTKSGTYPGLRAWSTTNGGEGGYLVAGDDASPAVGLKDVEGDLVAVLSSE